MLVLIALLIFFAFLTGGLGFALHWLWWIAIVLLILAIISAVVR
jgi:hypothetical protein